MKGHAMTKNSLFAVIDMKTKMHAAFNGRQRVKDVTFSRLLEPEEVEQFRANPQKFISKIEELSAKQENNGPAAA